MMYCDDYAILDTNYIVHATMIDPCTEHPATKPEYLIGVLLHIGHSAHPSAISYPQRSLRDMAFEQIVAMVKRENVQVEEDEEDE
jgi:hypothetical protein